MHECVICGCACYCSGDIDDSLVMSDAWVSEHCQGCDGPLCSDDSDDWEDYDDA